MNKTPYCDLIEQRKNCKECDGHGLCGDLNLSQEKGKLYQLETILGRRFPTNSLGLWDPASNSNPLTASVLIVGQDFSNVEYFGKINSLLQVNEIESKNATNINLLNYIELTGIDKNDIYFTNAILCIKSGAMNAPIKRKWIANCSNLFLKPLILEHLINLKAIITLGKVALDSVRVISEDGNKKISDFTEKKSFSSIPGICFDITIGGKQLNLYPMFHTGRLGASNASRVKKSPEDLWKAILQN